MTQAQFAKALKTSQGAVSRWEKGARKPWGTNLDALTEFAASKKSRRRNGKART